MLSVFNFMLNPQFHVSRFTLHVIVLHSGCRYEVGLMHCIFLETYLMPMLSLSYQFLNKKKMLCQNRDYILEISSYLGYLFS